MTFSDRQLCIRSAHCKYHRYPSPKTRLPHFCCSLQLGQKSRSSSPALSRRDRLPFSAKNTPSPHPLLRQKHTVAAAPALDLPAPLAISTVALSVAARTQAQVYMFDFFFYRLIRVYMFEALNHRFMLIFSQHHREMLMFEIYVEMLIC